MHAMVTTVPHPITAEQLECIHDDAGHRFELVEGRLVVMEPAGYAHGAATMAVALVLGSWIRDHGVGVSLAGEPGFILGRGPDSVRAPDFAFIRMDRVPSPPPDGFVEMTPDFAVEIVGKDAEAADVHDKARMWLGQGVEEVWVVDPRARTAAIHLPGREPETFTDDEEIYASGSLVGFSCRVGDLLDM
jgi:Uma2 family endonuclease